MSTLSMSRTLLVITAIGAAVFALLWNNYSECHSPCPSVNADDSRTGYLNYDCVGKPHQPSWSAWFHPERVWMQDVHKNGHRDRAGAVTRDWNILHHLGGVGPWVEKTADVVEGGIAVPDGCEVEQVHMVCSSDRYR